MKKNKQQKSEDELNGKHLSDCQFPKREKRWKKNRLFLFLSNK